MLLSNLLTNVLRQVRAGTLPHAVCDESVGPDMMSELKLLIDGGLIRAIDACADTADCFLNPEITFKGIEVLLEGAGESMP